ncbi:MAG TPA: BamA/TamA family outer membrane protein [Thermoanaerobaculia bacterium]|nr:BamA/TamA family outer membrane protein [Thermoanaerobaculia bacterium]
MRLLTRCFVVLALAICCVFVPSRADAQYFGRNKVQWENFNFKTLHTEHFDIYYYDREKDVVEDIGRMAERWYSRLSKVFNHQFVRKPIVLYANSADFQQTTTTGGLIGEGTGGFTDAFQNRVVLPLTGTYAENDHVLGHELVHVFQYDIANTARNSYGGSQRSARRFDLEALPLWLVEGMAEYFSKGRIDALTAMWIRDATNHDRLPDLRRLSSDPRYFPYRYGEALMAYLGGRYGDDQVIRYFLVSGVYGPEEAFIRVFNLPAKQVFANWQASARELYEPVFLSRPETLGTAFLGKKKTKGHLNIAPSISPDGKSIAFLSTRDFFSIDLFVADAQTGETIQKVVSSDGDPHFDSLRFIDSSGSWSPDSKKLAFVVYEKGDNRLAIVDVASRNVEQRIRIPGIDALANPAWSPDGHTIAFSGQATGVTDLFTYDLSNGQVRRLTNDKYADLQPSWSPDGRTLAFVSDRGAGTNLDQLRYDDMRLSTIDVASGAIRTLSIFNNTKHINPQFSPDGKGIYFIANAQGIPDVFRYAMADGSVSRITRVSTGVSGITELSPAMTVAAGTGQIVFSLYENDDYNIYELPASTVGEAVPMAVASAGEATRASLLPPMRAASANNYTSYLTRPEEGLLPPTTSFSSSGYDSRFHLTYLGPPTFGIGGDQFGYGAGGTISAAFSDVLGKQNIGFTVQGGGSSGGGSFGDQLGADVYYLNQQHRTNWGAEASHIPYVSIRTDVGSRVVNVNGQPVLAQVIRQTRFVQTQDAATVLTQYPLGLTRRIEAHAGYQRIGFKTTIEQETIVGNTIIDHTIRTIDKISLNLLTGSAAFVGDSSIFGFISPVKGTRYRYEVQALSGDLNFETLLLDYRRYFFLTPVTVAVRGLHYGRYGTDAESNLLSPLFVGQPSLVRGYESGSFNISECGSAPSGSCPVFDRLIGSRIGVVSLEMRVPLFGVREFGVISGAFLPTEFVAFADVGTAWSKGQTPKLKYTTSPTAERVPVFSAGVAARLLLAYIPLEFYYAKPFQRPDQGWTFGFNIAPGW